MRLQKRKLTIKSIQCKRAKCLMIWLLKNLRLKMHCKEQFAKRWFKTQRISQEIKHFTRPKSKTNYRSKMIWSRRNNRRKKLQRKYRKKIYYQIHCSSRSKSNWRKRKLKEGLVCGLEHKSIKIKLMQKRRLRKRWKRHRFKRQLMPCKLKLTLRTKTTCPIQCSNLSKTNWKRRKHREEWACLLVLHLPSTKYKPNRTSRTLLKRLTYRRRCKLCRNKLTRRVKLTCHLLSSSLWKNSWKRRKRRDGLACGLERKSIRIKLKLKRRLRKLSKRRSFKRLSKPCRLK